MKEFNDKIVAITGAGSGIGKALALEFGQLGAQLALNDYDADSLEETAKTLHAQGCKVYTQSFDVADRAAMYDFAAKVIEQYGKVDVMINNAGIALSRSSVMDVEYEDFEAVMNINFWGMVYGSKAFLPHLVNQKEASLVNISSLFGLVGISHQSAYCTSKFAIRGFTETLRSELCTMHPQVIATSVHPGGIRTNIARKSRIAKGEDPVQHQKESTHFEKKFLKTSAEQAAKVIIKGIRKKKGRVLIGSDAKFTSFIARLLPQKYVNILAAGAKREHRLSNKE